MGRSPEAPELSVVASVVPSHSLLAGSVSLGDKNWERGFRVLPRAPRQIPTSFMKILESGVREVNMDAKKEFET